MEQHVMEAMVPSPHHVEVHGRENCQNCAAKVKEMHDPVHGVFCMCVQYASVEKIKLKLGEREREREK